MKGNSWRVRRYISQDAQVVWDLHVLALQKVGAHSSTLGVDDDMKDVEKNYLQSGGDFLVMENEGNIVAMGALRKMTQERVELKRLRVHPDFQRQGLGQRMLTVLEKRAAELGYTAIQLDTTTRQIGAQKLFAKNGERKRETGI